MTWFVCGGQELSVLLEWSATEWQVLPQIWGQVSVGLGDGSIGCLGEITQSTGGATGRGVAILNTSHHQQLLWDWSRHNAGTTWGWDKTHRD